ncbi:MAG: hypothetical protein K6A35_06850 [bacterium]|nr:hypothetical protein [bacterium]
MSEISEQDTEHYSNEPAPEMAPYVPRASADEIREKSMSLTNSNIDLRELIEAMPYPAIILEDHRQMVVYNQAFASLLKVLALPIVLGARPGDALHCKYALGCRAGCGTTSRCRMCPAFQTIISALNGKVATNRCTMNIKTSSVTSLTVEASAMPLTINGNRYILMSLRDLGKEMRRHHADRAFFHDILNATWVINSYINLLKSTPELSQNVYLERLSSATSNLIEGIGFHRNLANAQMGELKVNKGKIDVGQVLQEIADANKDDAYARVSLAVDTEAPKVEVNLDLTIFKQVLLSLLKGISDNSDMGTIIEVTFRRQGPKVNICFCDRNSVLSQEEIDHFNTIYSTQEHRTLNSYTLEILTREYLNGEISLTSEANEGTKCTLSLNDKENP